LNLDITRDQIPRRWLDWNLARAKEKLADANRVIIWPNRGRGFGWFDDDFFRHKVFR
jgi:hypothetical protein